MFVVFYLFNSTNQKFLITKLKKQKETYVLKLITLVVFMLPK